MKTRMLLLLMVRVILGMVRAWTEEEGYNIEQEEEQAKEEEEKKKEKKRKKKKRRGKKKKKKGKEGDN